MSSTELAKITVYKNKEEPIRQISVRFYYDTNKKFKRFIEFYCMRNKQHPHFICCSTMIFDHDHIIRNTECFKIENSIEESIVKQIKFLITDHLKKYDFIEREFFVEEIREGLYSLKMLN